MDTDCGVMFADGLWSEATDGSGRLLVRHEHLLSSYLDCFWITEALFMKHDPSIRNKGVLR
jgi:hypothetical protein